MKHLNEYITEKLKINSKIKTHNYYPKTKSELRKILHERLEEDENSDLNDIDVSEITDMSGLFEHLDPHNIDISQWDVSNVTDMSYMFNWCTQFNSDLSKWDVSNVRDMKYMFGFCHKFNSDLSNWNVSNVKRMHYIFYECNSLKRYPNWYDIEL